MHRIARRMYGGLGSFRLPAAKAEPFLHYAKGSAERAALEAELKAQRGRTVEVPCVVGGERVFTGRVVEQRMPSDHGVVLARCHQADAGLMKRAIDASLAARASWSRMPFEQRAAVFLKAADLLSTKHRARVCAATMLGQSKNVWQAEIDAAVEAVDFFRFNVHFAAQIYADQPPMNSAFVWNRMEYRPLEGFVLAISPFNFTAIGANLPSAPAIMGNTAIWKPSDTAALSNYYVYELLEEAGLPAGVINFVPCAPQVAGEALRHRSMAGLHFTGSTATFNHLQREIASNLDKYTGYPRIVGETGGKNFHFVHASANVDNVVNNTLRGAFEYQGQKCSATSRMYVPASLWPGMRDRLVEAVRSFKVGQPDAMDTFVAAVIDKRAHDKIAGYLAHVRAAESAEARVLVGGTADASRGYFVAPTIVETTNPHFKTMQEEIFGPVLTVYVYPDAKYVETLRLCASTSPYALTGSIFATDRTAIVTALDELVDAAGNIYINDKSTGAVVGEQPFGGARASGTNDKAGSYLNLLRWTSARTLKENFVPLQTWRYPHMASS